MIERIVSGGQTGADQGGLDAAIALGLPHGGWCPANRRSEAGPIPERYLLQETTQWEYPMRTKYNVRETDGTVIFTVGEATGGSALTIKYCEENTRPYLHVDMGALDESESVEAICDWIDVYSLHVINVAGSRESKEPGIQEAVCKVIMRVVEDMKGHP